MTKDEKEELIKLIKTIASHDMEYCEGMHMHGGVDLPALIEIIENFKEDK